MCFKSILELMNNADVDQVPDIVEVGLMVLLKEVEMLIDPLPMFAMMRADLVCPSLSK